MTDEELIARLRQHDGWVTLEAHTHLAAADRIEALTAKLATCEKYRDAYDEMGRIGTQAVRDLEAKLAKAVDALERAKASIENGGGGGVVDVVWLDDPCPETLCDFIDATLAEIKGESHE